MSLPAPQDLRRGQSISRRLSPSGLLALLILALLVACTRPAAPKFVDNEDCSSINKAALPHTTATLKFDTGYEIDVDAEVASTTAARAQGLMCREEVNRGTGMIFLYDEPVTGPYWMFNTYVDLDIVYIADGGAIADIKRMTSCVRNDDSQEQWTERCDEASSQYVPEQPYVATIELPADWLNSVTPQGARLSIVAWE